MPDYMANFGPLDKIKTPFEPEYNKHVYYLYTIKVLEKRDGLQEYLKSDRISTCVYYPLPLHLQEVYRDLRYGKGDFPASEKCSGEVLSLPIYPELGETEIKAMANKIKGYFEGK